MQGVLPGPLHRQDHALHQRSGDQWGSPGVGPGRPPGPRIATGRVQGSIDGSAGLGAVRTIQVGHVAASIRESGKAAEKVALGLDELNNRRTDPSLK